MAGVGLALPGTDHYRNTQERRTGLAMGGLIVGGGGEVIINQ